MPRPKYASTPPLNMTSYQPPEEGVPLITLQEYLDGLQDYRDPTIYQRLFDDFMGDDLRAEWNGRKGSDDEALAPALVSSPAQGGVVRLVTGDDAAGTMTVNGSQLAAGAFLNWRADQDGLEIEARIRISALTNVAVFFGFTDQDSALEMPILSAASADAITTNATDAVGMMFDSAMATAGWWSVGVANDVDANGQALGAQPTAGAFETLGVKVDKTGVARFFRNRVQLGLSMMNAVRPTIPLTPVLAAFSRGAASRNIDMDFVQVQAKRAT